LEEVFKIHENDEDFINVENNPMNFWYEGINFI